MPRLRWMVVGLGTVALVTITWVACGWDPMSGHVTAYAAICLRRSADGRCAVLGRTLEPAVFYVSKSHQQVGIAGENGTVVQLRSCTVQSRTDWRCRSASDDAHELGLTRGRPWVRIAGSAASDLVFLPRWRYLWLRTGEYNQPQQAVFR